jgi:hypothetical protein
MRINPLWIAVIGAATAALSPSAWPQQQHETDRALVHRDTPAQGAFSEAIVRRLRVQPGFRVDVWASGLGHPLRSFSGGELAGRLIRAIHVIRARQ